MIDKNSQPVDGVALIAAERAKQQRADGYDPKHDDEHRDGELALAAVAYALPESFCASAGVPWPWPWPWDAASWKPGDRIRDLSKAGALLAAEIDRLQRVKD